MREKWTFVGARFEAILAANGGVYLVRVSFHIHDAFDLFFLHTRYPGRIEHNLRRYFAW